MELLVARDGNGDKFLGLNKNRACHSSVEGRQESFKKSYTARLQNYVSFTCRRSFGSRQDLL